jgi:DNA mismatch repair protein MutL
MSRSRVRVLPDEIANRIAAGEVVERPASVVKELVENSVDAGASRVRVRLEGAGKRRVAVEDDGEGMSREDALLALERHATSKIESAEDLEAISTLGFRGEALASIPAVCRFRLITRSADDTEGTEIRAEGGRVVSVEAVGAPRGSTVEVDDLFYNVPARRKFLKGDATELRAAVETVTQLALVHYDVGFELRSEERSLLALPPDQALEERAQELVGAQLRGGLHWGRATVAGMDFVLAFAAPHEGRGHRRGVRLFVNGRPVQDRLLFGALMEGYRGLLGAGRYPVALLWLQVSPEAVDVNVHPAKREVRFRDGGAVFRWVAGQTAEALAGVPRAAGPKGSPNPATVPDPLPAERTASEPSPRPEARRVAEAVAAHAARNRRAGGEQPRPWRPAPLPRVPNSASSSFRQGRGGLIPEAGREGFGMLRPRFGNLRYLGAFDATYLLFEDADGPDLVVLDQHAAHERILYEAFLDRAEGAGSAIQPLLFPATLECAAAEMAAFEERREDLDALGFAVEAFGPTTLVLRAAPAALAPGAAEAVIRDFLSAGDFFGQAVGPRERREAGARRAACSAAVKARAVLVASEIEALLERLDGLKNPSHCPHGRPLLLRLSRKDVEGMFHRR